MFLADTNADGKADLIKFNTSGTVYTFLSNGDGTFDEANYHTNDGPGGAGKGYVNIADINGDGRVDLIKHDSGGAVYTYITNSDGSFSTSYHTTNGPGGDGENKVTLADSNGDGKADLIKLDSDVSNVYVYNFLSNGDGTFDSNYSTNTSAVPNIHVADINTDGLTDLIRYKDDGTVHMYPSKGDGTFDGNYFSHTGPGGEGSGLVHFADVNGDGYTDLIKQKTDGTVYTYLAHGDGTFEDDRSNSGPGGDGEGLVHFADVNGDRLGDLIKHSNDGTVYTYVANGDSPAGLLTAMRNTPGASIDLEYESSSSYQNTLLPFVLYTVSSMSVDDGFDNLTIMDYTYSGGLYDHQTREFRGFEQVKQTNHNDTTVETWYHQEEYLKGRQYKVEAKDSLGELLTETNLTWEKVYLTGSNGIWAFVKLVRKRTENYDDETVFVQKDYIYDDEDETYTEKAGNLIETVSSGRDAESITKINVYENVGDWVWRLTQATLLNEASSKVRETTYEYEADTGNLLAKEYWHEEGTNPRMTMTYDTYGNPETLTDARLNLTTTEFDVETHTFPVRIIYPETNGVSHIKEFGYNDTIGKVAWEKDVNGNETSYTYDAFGRPEQVDYPDGGQAGTIYYDYALPRQKITWIKENGVGNTIDKYEYRDGLGRLIQAITFGEDNKSIITRIHYDEMGRKYLVEGPFFASGVGYPKEPPTEYPWQQTFYDDRGRPVRVDSPDAEHGTITATISYSGFSTIMQDPDGAKKTETKDYLGRVIQVIEHGDYEQQYITRYEYNAAGDPLKTIDAENNETIITYDTLGRKRTIQDADMGYWAYTYDDNGNLKTQTDAKNQTITFTYDELNRVTDNVYTESGTTTEIQSPVTYTYDLAVNGTGRLSSVSNSKVTTAFNEYDVMGREKSVSKIIDGDPAEYTTDFEYDYSGKLTRIIYPDGFDVSYGYYPGSGLMRSVMGSDLVEYAVYTQYEPTGKTGQVNNGNETATRYSYDSWSTRLTGIITADPTYKPENDILNREYNYTPAGDISKITNDLKGITYEYEYDKLHRLVGETSTGTQPPTNYTVLSFDHDDPNHAHAVSEITLNSEVYSYFYDGNGNMTGGPDATDPANVTSRALTYNADNMPIQIDHANGVVEFVYDGDGKRAKKIVLGGSVTYYIGGHFEIKAGVITKHIFSGDTRIASIVGSSVYYFHKDHLGSSTAVTDANAVVVETTEHSPFGAIREHTGSDVTNYRFTDQELDPETGLYNYGARLYDPIIGRFTSPDPTVQAPFDPQTLNRYTYCGNSPLNYIDPSGYGFFSWIKRKIKKVVTTVISAVVTVVVTAATGNPVLGAMAGGAISAAINGGGLKEIFVSAVLSGLTYGASQAIPPPITEQARNLGFSCFPTGPEPSFDLVKAGSQALIYAAVAGIHAGISDEDMGYSMLTGAAAGFSSYAASTLPKVPVFVNSLSEQNGVIYSDDGEVIDEVGIESNSVFETAGDAAALVTGLKGAFSLGKLSFKSLKALIRAKTPPFSSFSKGEKWFIRQLRIKAGPSVAKDYQKLAPFVNKGARHEVMKSLSKKYDIKFPY